jgi:hypothetical protein
VSTILLIAAALFAGVREPTRKIRNTYKKRNKIVGARCAGKNIGEKSKSYFKKAISD